MSPETATVLVILSTVIAAVSIVMTLITMSRLRVLLNWKAIQESAAGPLTRSDTIAFVNDRLNERLKDNEIAARTRIVEELQSEYAGIFADLEEKSKSFPDMQELRADLDDAHKKIRALEELKTRVDGLGTSITHEIGEFLRRAEEASNRRIEEARNAPHTVPAPTSSSGMPSDLGELIEFVKNKATEKGTEEVIKQAVAKFRDYWSR